MTQGRVARNVCLRGHNKTEVGRLRDGSCAECKRIRGRAERALKKPRHPVKRAGRTPSSTGMLTTAPIDRLVAEMNAGRPANEPRMYLPPSLERNLYRSRRRGGFTYDAADQFACWFGLHPTALWGWDWFGDMEETA